MINDNGSWGDLTRIIRSGKILFDTGNPDHRTLLQALIVNQISFLDQQVQLSDENPAWEVVPHEASTDPLAKASDKVTDYLSSLIGSRPYGYLKAEHTYLERSGFLVIPGQGALIIPRAHFCNWLPANGVADLTSFDPNLHTPLTIDLVVFEHPESSQRFVFQAVEHGQVRKPTDSDWTDYSIPYDTGVYLLDPNKILGLKQLGLMPPKIIDLK